MSTSSFENFTNNFHNKITSFFGDSNLYDDKKYIELGINSIVDFLPYKFYDKENQIFINNESLGFVLRIGNLFGANSKDIEIISNLLRDNIPEGSFLQILNYASPRVGNLLKNFENSSKKAQDQIQILTKKRTEFIKNANWKDFGNNESNYRIRNFKTFLIFSIKIKDVKSDIFDQLAKLKSFLNTKENIFISNKIKELNLIKQNFISLLTGIGLGGALVEADEFIKLIDEILNANCIDTMESSKKYDNLELISKQVSNIENRIEVLEDGVSLFSDNPDKNVIAKCFSFKSYPITFSQSESINLIGDYSNDLAQIPCAFLQTICVFFPYNSESEKSKIKLKSMQLQKNKENPLLRFFPEIKEKSDEYNFVSKKLDEGQKIVEIWNQVMLISKPEVLETGTRNLSGIYTRSGFTLVHDKYLSLQSFLAFLPFILGDGLFDDMKSAKRTDKVLSWTVANLAPLQGEPKGNLQEPCMMLFGRRGQPFFFHPFKSPAGGNFNTCIVGKSGSGKSFFMQDYIMSIRRLGGRMIIVDDGQSFQKTCFYLDGKYIEFTEGNTISLNPFSFLENENDLNKMKALEETENEAMGKNSFYDEVINFIKKLIKTIVTREDEVCSKEEGELINLAVEIAIKRKGHLADLALVSSICLEMYNDKEVERPKFITDLLYGISLKMTAFTKGEFSKYFKGKANIKIDNDFVVFELSHIKDKPELQRTITLYASFLGFKEMYLGDRNKIKSFVVDEAWALLAGKEMADFMEAMARRARKYNGQLVIATQSIDDFYKSPATTAILQNSDYLCIMAQKPESITTLEKSGKVGDMSKHLKDTLLSVKTKRGEYSEVVIYAHGNYAVSRLIVDPFAVKLYSSDAREFKQIEDFMSQGYSLVESLEIAVERDKNKKL